MGIEGLYCLVMCLGHESFLGLGLVDVCENIVRVWCEGGENLVWDIAGGNSLDEGVGCRIGTCYSRRTESNKVCFAKN
jgi:hypothetical protein